MQQVPSKLSPSGHTPAGNKIHPTSEDRKANVSRVNTPTPQEGKRVMLIIKK